jgi:hypothetical protein
MKITLKKYSNCNSKTVTLIEQVDASLLGVLTTYNGVWVSDGTYTTAPFDFAEIFDPTLSFIVSWEINPLGNYPLGVYPLSISGNDGNEYFVIVEVIAACELPTYELSCCNSLNIVWVNREGGFENYIFTGKNKVFEIESGDEITFKNSDLQRKYAEKKSIYRALQIGTGRIPKAHSVKIESLRNSIQAWLYDEALPPYIDFSERLIPIYIDFDSFTVLDTSVKGYEANIRFLIAKELVIQSQ